MRLRPVPRAAVRGAQKAEDGEKVVVCKAGLFKERLLGDDQGAGGVVRCLPVRFKQGDALCPAALHKISGRFVAEQLAQCQLHIPRYEVAVDIVHGEGERGTRALGEGIGGEGSAVAREYLRRREGGIRLGYAAEHAHLLPLLQHDLRGYVFRHAAVYAVDDVSALCRLEHGGGELFVEGIEITAGSIHGVQRFKGDAQRPHPRGRGRFARAQDDPRAGSEGGLCPLGKVGGAAPRADNGDHICPPRRGAGALPFAGSPPFAALLENVFWNERRRFRHMRLFLFY